MENDILDIFVSLADALAPYVISAIAGIIIVVLNHGVNYLKDKFNSEMGDKYINMAQDLVVKCVKATNQTYVDSLKKNGAFDQNAWVTAFEKSKNKVIKLLSEAQKEVITEVYGDVESWLNMQIEATVNELKKSKELAAPTSQVVNINQLPSEIEVEDYEGADIVMSE